jgi:hypothetical protein
MTASNEMAPERRQLDELLPWHAAGTLARHEAERVEAALAVDAMLARHYEIVREELAETIHLNETLGAPSARPMEKLFAAIDADGSPTRRARSFAVTERLTRVLAGFRPHALALSAVAVLAIIVQAGVIAHLYLGQHSYQSASVEAGAPSGPRTDALIRFVPQASAADVTKFLESYRASIVEGPLAGNLYRIRIAGVEQPQQHVSTVEPTRVEHAAVGPSQELVRTIERMRAESAIVGFVAPAE